MTDPLVIETFAGPGGWSTGLRAAGFTGRAVGIEWDAAACETARAAGHERVQDDVAAHDLAPYVGKVWGKIGSPPCQAWSMSGLQGGEQDRDNVHALIDDFAAGRTPQTREWVDERSQLTAQPMRYIVALRPRWVALEQVPTVLPLWRHIAMRLRELGYRTWTGVLSAEEYGVPQTRKRAILMASLDGPVGPPAPTHQPYRAGRGVQVDADLFGSPLPPPVTMAEALGWTADVAYRRTRGTGMSERFGTRPDTPVTRPAPTITGKTRSDSWVLTRPSTTVLGDPRIGRPGHKHRDAGERQFENGSLHVTVEEAAVLQSFPVDYPWRGSKTAQHQQVGDAVPPLLASAVLGALLAVSTGVAGLSPAA